MVSFCNVLVWQYLCTSIWVYSLSGFQIIKRDHVLPSENHHQFNSSFSSVPWAFLWGPRQCQFVVGSSKTDMDVSPPKCEILHISFFLFIHVNWIWRHCYGHILKFWWFFKYVLNSRHLFQPKKINYEFGSLTKSFGMMDTSV